MITGRSESAEIQLTDNGYYLVSPQFAKDTLEGWQKDKERRIQLEKQIDEMFKDWQEYKELTVKHIEALNQEHAEQIKTVIEEKDKEIREVKRESHLPSWGFFIGPSYGLIHGNFEISAGFGIVIKF